MSQIPIFKIRASMAWVLLTEPKEKSNLQLYIEAVDSLSTKQRQYSDLKKKDGTQGEKWLKEIAELKSLIPELEKEKDVKRLSETLITYLKQWIIEQKYGRKKEFKSNQTDKGNETEQDGLQVIQEYFFPDGEVFIGKSKLYFEDDYKTGHLDAFIEIPFDNKSSYTPFSFPFMETVPDPKYVPQMNVYMDFTKTETSQLCYTLNDTPFEIVDKELRYWCRNNGIDFDLGMPEDKAYDIIKNHVYTREGLKKYPHVLGTLDTSDFIEIPKEKRIKPFEIKKDNAMIDKLHKVVIYSREWIADNWDNF